MQDAERSPLAGGRLSYFFLQARDFRRMLAYYRDGLGLSADYLEEDRCAFLRPDGGGPRLAIYAGREEAPAGGVHWLLAFDVPDVDAAVARLRRRGLAVGDVEDVPFGRAAKLTDPEGNPLEIHEPARRA